MITTWSRRGRLFLANNRSGGGDAPDPLGEGNTDLLAALDALGFVPSVFHDRRKGVAVSAGLVTQVDDVRGASGFGPSLTPGPSGGPAWDAVNQRALNTSASSLKSAASAALNWSAGGTLVIVGSVPTTSTQTTYHVTGAGSGARIAQNGTGIQGSLWQSSSINTSPNTPGASAIRCIFIGYSAVDNTWWTWIAGAAAVQGRVLAAPANESDAMAIFGTNSLGTASTNLGAMWCADLFFPADLAADALSASTAMQLLAAWAETYHGAVAT